MSRNHENIDSVQKDMLIGTMKKELYELKKLGHEHLALVDEVKNIQSKHNLLEDENMRLQHQLKTKSELNRKIITELRNQIDGLKIQIHKCSVQIDDIMRENANLKRVCENRDSEIAMQMSVNQQLQKNNEDQIQIDQILSNKIKAVKDQRNKCQGQCERLKRHLDQQISNLKALEKQARHLEANNNKLESIIRIADNDNIDLVEDLKTRQQKLSTTNIRLEQLKHQRDDLRQKTTKLEKECLKSEADLKKVKNDLENTILKNKELTKKLKNLENNYRNSENDYEKAKILRQGLNKEYLALQGDHKDLNGEIDRCMLSVLEYQRINQELQRQIQHFIQCDEEARTMLSRKDAMRNLLEQVSLKLHKTSEDIAHLR